jgi:predicted phosphodiesterase
MRVAVFSDVQANLQAFEVVAEDILRWDPELVIMAGDLVNRGPDNPGCLELFDELRRERGWLPVQGNHEEWVLRCFEEEPKSPLEAEMRRFTDWAAAQIGAERARLLAGWADHLCFHGPDGGWVHITHGSMLGNRAGISRSVPDTMLDERLPDAISLFVGGHTHKVHRRNYRGVEVVNVGSVGSPFDCDDRASYGRFEFRNGRWRTDIVRLAYDRAATERDFEDSGFIDGGGPLARIIYEEWKRADLLIRFWRERYQAAVRAGEISLQRSVDEFLARAGKP